MTGIGQGLSLGGLSIPEQQGDESELRTLDAERQALIAAAYGARPLCLLVVDQEGTAYRLAGALPSGRGGPRLLEALESRALWREVQPGTTYLTPQLAELAPAWAPELLTDAHVRFFFDGDRPLGNDDENTLKSIVVSGRCRPIMNLPIDIVPNAPRQVTHRGAMM